MKRLLAAWLLAACVLPAVAAERWQSLPPTPSPLPTERRGHASVDGISIYYAVYGQGPPMILLHGGLANADYWGWQVPALRARHTVILMDSRGHGRSTRDGRAFTYDLMADDVVGLMDVLHVARADVVGWSDGAIIGLDMAMRYPARMRRLFAFAGNVSVSGGRPGATRRPAFAAYLARVPGEYARLSATPGEYSTFADQVGAMWASQPDWSSARLQTVKARVLVADGDHDEAIRRAHTEYMAKTIPGASLLILPNVSHFAFLQDPETFNLAVLRFLNERARRPCCASATGACAPAECR